MEKKAKLKQNNAGLSLVELVIVILISSLLMGMVAIFISTSRRSYQSIASEEQLQDEAAFAMRYIEEIAVEAKECSFDEDADIQAFYIKAPDMDTKIVSSGDYYYFVVREKDTNTLRFAKLSEADLETGVNGINISGTVANNGIIGAERKLLAKYATDLSVTKDGNLMNFDIQFTVFDRTYEAKRTIAGRNILTND